MHFINSSEASTGIHYNTSLLTMSVSASAEIKRIEDNENRKLTALTKELKSLERRYSQYWHWRRKNGRFYFWECIDGRQHGITGNYDRIHTLARRDYLKLRVSKLKHRNYDTWCSSLENLLQKYADIGLNLKRILLTPEQFRWAAKPNSQNSSHREGLQYKTNGGVLVRSKSEQIIGNILEEFCIPYRYEPEMRIGNRTFHPDFVILTEDNRKIILEHLGRMDLVEYIHNNIDRLAAYASADLIIEETVFLSFEQNVKDRDSLMSLIYRILAA